MPNEVRRAVAGLRALTVLAVFAVSALAAYVLLYHECADGGAMASDKLVLRLGHRRVADARR
jgi:hypothetical protein